MRHLGLTASAQAPRDRGCWVCCWRDGELPIWSIRNSQWIISRHSYWNDFRGRAGGVALCGAFTVCFVLHVRRWRVIKIFDAVGVSCSYGLMFMLISFGLMWLTGYVAMILRSMTQ